MQAKKLELKNFRNYKEQTIAFQKGINILHGDNAQGKTNVLEAIYLFSMGKANRARRDMELIRHGEEKAWLALDFADKERDSRTEITLFKNRPKTITVNEIPIRKNSELMGRFRVVYFGPEYLGLVKEGPKARRKNTDIFISQLRPRYFASLSDAKKLVESKNALLKMDKPNLAMLDVLNEKLAAKTAEIIAYRAEYIEKFAGFAADLQREISGGQEDLDIRYDCCVRDFQGLDVGALQEKVYQKIEESRRRELDCRESVVGPHREDLTYLINGQEAKLYASQGQQKTVVLVQKLAEVALMQKETGELPVLLLDDIMSELDKKRQSFILNHIRDMQILITCTDIDGFDLSGDTALFTVENGNVTREE